MKEYTEKNVSCEIELRVNVSSEENVKKFLSDFNTSSGCSFNVQSGRPDKNPKGDNARSQLPGYRKCCLNVSHCEGKDNQEKTKYFHITENGYSSTFTKCIFV